MKTLEECLTHHRAPLMSYGYTLTRNEDAAADLIAEASRRVLDRYPDTDAERLPSLLAVIMRNHWNDARRGYIDSRSQPIDATNEWGGSYADLLPAPGDFTEDLAEDAQRRADAAKVRRVLGLMPERMGAVLVRVDLEGMSYTETARVLDLPIGTVRSNVSRARARFRAIWARKRGRPAR